MSYGDSLLHIGFFETGTTASSRFDRIEEIASKISAVDIQKIGNVATTQAIRDLTISTTSDAIEALTLGYDPRHYAGNVWEKCQELSDSIASLNGQIANPRALGASSEAAIHGLLWWGIANQGFGRWARLTVAQEDSSGPNGPCDGFDTVFRTDSRRHRLQTKSGVIGKHLINKYAASVIVLSPGDLMRESADTATNSMHQALALDKKDCLDGAWSRLLHELRTQKAPNGSRRVI
ncbi:MAG: hypothetical protein ACREGF_06300 [Candidatus Saccharimonadales bacterium]